MDVQGTRETATGGEGPDFEGPFRLGEWAVDPAANRVARDGREVRLEPKVMRVLVLLATRAGEVVTRRDLEENVWPRMLVSDDAVTNTLIKLRRALGDDAKNPRYIETIAKSGYRLIAEVAPLDAPAVETAAEDAGGAAAAPSGPRLGRAWTRPALLAAAVLLVLAFAWLASRGPTVPVDAGPATTAAPPVVAVLPFENLTGDPGEDYFADGVTQDLITDLSKLSGLRVVARSSVMGYRGSADTDRQIGAELGARFVVRGSVQRAGQRLRINVQLTDAQQGRNRWAERYDRELADIFRVQDDITARVVSALEVELAPGERQRLVRTYVTSVEAYDEYLRGLDLLGRRSDPDNVEAKAHFDRAIALEPRFARAYAGLAQSYSQDAVYDRGPRVLESLAEAEVLARKGLAIDDSLPQLRFVIGMVEMFKGNLSEATNEVLRAIELKPSYADGYGLLARIMHFAGRPQEGLDALDQAIRLNPRVPAIYRMVHGALLYQLGRYDEALRELEASVEVSPNLLLSRLYLAATYAATGRDDAARWEVDEVLASNPGFTLAYLDQGFPMRDPELRQRLAADLRHAGLPDR